MDYRLNRPIWAGQLVDRRLNTSLCAGNHVDHRLRSYGQNKLNTYIWADGMQLNELINKG